MTTQYNNASVARTIYESFNNRDFDQALSFVADDFEWWNMPTGQVFRGPEGYKQLMHGWAIAFPDSKVEITNLFCEGDWCTVQFTGRGTHSGPLMDPSGQIPPTGRRVELSFCDVLRFRNGKIIGGHSYFDMASMLQQLGLLPQTRQMGR